MSGWLTLGWFAINKSYFARPNNTGLALFRYAVHTEISFWNDHLALGLDAIIFTDKLASNMFRPSELDFTPELIVRYERYEVHLAYERDMPLDQDEPDTAVRVSAGFGLVLTVAAGSHHVRRARARARSDSPPRSTAQRRGAGSSSC